MYILLADRLLIRGGERHVSRPVATNGASQAVADASASIIQAGVVTVKVEWSDDLETWVRDSLSPGESHIAFYSIGQQQSDCSPTPDARADKPYAYVRQIYEVDRGYAVITAGIGLSRA